MDVDVENYATIDAFWHRHISANLKDPEKVNWKNNNFYLRRSDDSNANTVLAEQFFKLFWPQSGEDTLIDFEVVD